jgi:hypothetical protein
MFGIEHLCFTELLPYWVSVVQAPRPQAAWLTTSSQVATALSLRKPTFLARPEWKTVPWSAQGCSKDIMECLLEHTVDLPALLWRYDQYILALRTRSKPSVQLNIQLARLWVAVGELEARLRRWKRGWADCYPAGQPYEVPSQGADFPVFRYLDTDVPAVITPPTLIYPDPQLARTLCMYYATMLLLSSIDTRQVDRIPRSESLEFARLICRSMEYYIRAVPGNMINRMAFPLRIAYDLLPRESLEKRFVEEVFMLVERKNALKLWGKGISDIALGNS